MANPFQDHSTLPARDGPYEADPEVALRARLKACPSALHGRFLGPPVLLADRRQLHARAILLIDEEAPRSAREWRAVSDTLVAEANVETWNQARALLLRESRRQAFTDALGKAGDGDAAGRALAEAAAAGEQAARDDLARRLAAHGIHLATLEADAFIAAGADLDDIDLRLKREEKRLAEARGRLDRAHTIDVTLVRDAAPRRGTAMALAARDAAPTRAAAARAPETITGEAMPPVAGVWAGAGQSDPEPGTATTVRADGNGGDRDDAGDRHGPRDTDTVTVGREAHANEPAVRSDEPREGTTGEEATASGATTRRRPGAGAS
jgi:hypothetical protein